MIEVTRAGQAPTEGTAPEHNALDSAPDSDLDQYCNRMQSETAQGDELTIRAAALALRRNIRVLKLNSTTGTIMSISYPGILPSDYEEEPGNSNQSEMNDQELQTITIAHYVHQHGGAGHYNPIIQSDENMDSPEGMDISDGMGDDT